MLRFTSGRRSFFLPASQVREVVGQQRLTRIPRAPESLLGLINVRGAAVPVLSLANLLGKKSCAEARIILLDGDTQIGLAVDRVATVTQRDAAQADGAKPIDLAPLIAKDFAGLAPRSGRRSAPVRRQRTATRDASRLQLLAFAIGDQELALPLDAIDAVIAAPKTIARVPGGEAAVLGTADWRGRLLPLLSLSVLLGLPGDADAKGRVLVLSIDGARIGLRVDRLTDVLALDPASVDLLPAALTRGAGEARIQAVARLDGGHRLVSILASGELLAPEHRRGLARDAQAEVATTRMAVDAGEPVLLFTLGGAPFGLPLAAIDEVARVPARLTPVPQAAGVLVGLMELRGRALPVIDQAQRFGGEATTGARAIVARAGALEAAFLVDRIIGVVRVPADRLASAPPLGGEGLFDRTMIDGEGGPITLLINAFALLAGTERALLAMLAARADDGDATP
ncbi:chemotaxis protein CheW [Sphingomonas sp. AP4-R1]|uniref:chemotaxis protein CheW n=1 Tax=Sphingomonas sp. AP4-R1 TaxID=2735134 RepID=UPI001493B377|nr:chemotaxis protein CheW [Sphingomonas sp. AP4-R1]QJU59365.1 chemotaxis protein CheW [Sphingomonas sp. AP4-R1]